MKKIILTLCTFAFAVAGYTQSFSSAKNISCCSSVNGFALDNVGNMYVAGTFYGDDYVGANYITSATPFKYNSFIAKTNKTGKVMWVKVIGSNESSTVQRIATDNSGNVFITGSFMNDLIYDASTITSSGANDAFIMKINAAGTLQWWDHTIGTASEFYYDVAVNSAGDAYVTGKFNGSMNVQGEYYFVAPESVTNMCVLKFSGSSGSLLWARQTNSTLGSNSSGSRIAVDNLGSAYVLGNFGTGYTTFGDYTIYGSFNDYFVSKFDDLSNFTYTFDIGDIPNGYICNIDADAAGNIYLAGNFGMFSPYTATISGTLITSPGNSELFIAKYNSDFTQQWLRTGGGSSTGDFANDLIVSNDGDVYTAFTSGASVTFGSVSATSAHPGGNDIALVKYNSSGTEQWAKVAGGANYDAVSCIDISESKHVLGMSGIGGNNMFFDALKVKKPNLYVVKLVDAAMRTENEGIAEAEKIIVYPNPASDKIMIGNIQVGDRIEIFNAQGGLVFTTTATDIQEEISLDSYAEGIYFISVSNEVKRNVEKFVLGR